MWYEVFYPGTSTSNFLAQENMHMSKQALVHICDTGVSWSIRDRRIPHLLCIILWLNFDEVCLFYLYKSDVDTLCKYLKKLFPEMCNFSALPLALNSWININNKN